jgi:hypothetical protein
MAMSDAQLCAVQDWMRDTPPEPEAEPGPRQSDFSAAGQVFLLVIGVSVLPILPFLLVDPVPLAMRLSSAVAVAMLVVIGWRLEQQMQGGRCLMRWMIPVVGLVMVAVTIALGG